MEKDDVIQRINVLPIFVKEGAYKLIARSRKASTPDELAV